MNGVARAYREDTSLRWSRPVHLGDCDTGNAAMVARSLAQYHPSEAVVSLVVGSVSMVASRSYGTETGWAFQRRNPKPLG